MLDIKTPIHIHEDDLDLYLSGHVESERLSFIEHHLLECRICQAHLFDCAGQQLRLQSIQRTHSEVAQKRSEERFSTEGVATVQELHPLSLERHTVKVVDVSKNGLGIVSPKAMLPGTIVQLRMKDIVELGNVRYCSELGGGGFRIGVRLNGEG